MRPHAKMSEESRHATVLSMICLRSVRVRTDVTQRCFCVASVLFRQLADVAEIAVRFTMHGSTWRTASMHGAFSMNRMCDVAMRAMHRKCARVSRPIYTGSVAQEDLYKTIPLETHCCSPIDQPLSCANASVGTLHERSHRGSTGITGSNSQSKAWRITDAATRIALTPTLGCQWMAPYL